MLGWIHIYWNMYWDIYILYIGLEKKLYRFVVSTTNIA